MVSNNGDEQLSANDADDDRNHIIHNIILNNLSVSHTIFFLRIYCWRISSLCPMCNTLFSVFNGVIGVYCAVCCFLLHCMWHDSFYNCARYSLPVHITKWQNWYLYTGMHYNFQRRTYSIHAAERVHRVFQSKCAHTAYGAHGVDDDRSLLITIGTYRNNSLVWLTIRSLFYDRLAY